MSTVNNAYGAIAKLNLWFKVRTGDTYVLSDFPEIVIKSKDWRSKVTSSKDNSNG